MVVSGVMVPRHSESTNDETKLQKHTRADDVDEGREMTHLAGEKWK